MQKEIKILAIETSCDETAAAVIAGSWKQEAGRWENPVILSNVISSQADLHAKTGGVVPEVASRAHVEAIVPVVAQALLSAKYRVLSTEFGKKLDYQEAIKYLQSEITHIAVTAGPGLIGALLIGFNAAKTLAYALDKPIIPINHIEGHIYSALCAEVLSNEYRVSSEHIENKSTIPNLKFPILIFTASGGHTLLILMHDHDKHEILGQTIDDAIGEAYDKVARLLGLGYPGGPLVSALAKQYRQQIINYQLSTRLPDGQVSNQILNTKYQILDTIKFPRPIMNDGTYNFSFSGLKTSVLNKVKALEQTGDLEQKKMEICAAFEEAVADVVSTKIARAAIEFEPKAIAFAGGVAANDYLREKIQEKTGQAILVPAKGLTGDNAAMIGLAAYYHILRGDVKRWSEIKVDSNLSL